MEKARSMSEPSRSVCHLKVSSCCGRFEKYSFASVEVAVVGDLIADVRGSEVECQWARFDAALRAQAVGELFDDGQIGLVQCWLGTADGG